MYTSLFKNTLSPTSILSGTLNLTFSSAIKFSPHDLNSFFAKILLYKIEKLATKHIGDLSNTSHKKCRYLFSSDTPISLFLGR